MENKTVKNANLFGLSIVAYGFADLFCRHPIDFLTLLGHISNDYFFKQYSSEYPIKYIDTELEEKIVPRPGTLKTYFSLVPFFIGSLGFLKWQYGNRAREDVCQFMADIKNFYIDAGFVYKNAPTKLRHRQSPGLGLKLLHFFDRPTNCFPSLHVALAAYSYLRTQQLLNKFSPNGDYSREKEVLRRWSLSIIESCLFTKQHGFRDIAGSLAMVTAKFPQFDQSDTRGLINSLFFDTKNFPEELGSLARNEIGSVYTSLVNEISKDAPGDYRSALVSYVRRV